MLESLRDYVKQMIKFIRYEGGELEMVGVAEVKFLEPEVSREASKYIEENYGNLLRNIIKMGVPESKAGDLLNDVYVSIVEAENNGEGYDFNKSTDGNGIYLEQFIYGRIKGYSKNIRYSNDKVEGNDEIAVYASSVSDEEIDEMNSFQKAYALASTYDEEIYDIEDAISIRERIDYCLDFEHCVKGISLIELFKNIDILATMEFDKSVFNSLKEAFQIHDEFAEAFKDVVEYAMNHKNSFKEIIATY